MAGAPLRPMAPIATRTTASRMRVLGTPYSWLAAALILGGSQNIAEICLSSGREAPVRLQRNNVDLEHADCLEGQGVEQFVDLLERLRLQNDRRAGNVEPAPDATNHAVGVELAHTHGFRREVRCEFALRKARTAT